MMKRALNSLGEVHAWKKNLSACGVVLVFKAGKRESVIIQEKHYLSSLLEYMSTSDGLV